MKRLARLPLSPEAQAFLSRRAAAVALAAQPRAEAARLWKQQGHRAFREIRTQLGRMASGLDRCMYCEDSEGTAIEHFWPKAVYPERAFDWLNYLLACTLCNSNSKRDRFPLDEAGLPLLLNPTEDEPLDHLALSPWTGKLTGLTPKGEHSIPVFALDRANLENGRRSAWIALESLLAEYARFRRSGNAERAAQIESTVRNYPFAGVFAALLRIAAGPDAALLVEETCLAALRECPDVLTWS
jgi:uncharacterized protein (TIGR02646 family)